MYCVYTILIRFFSDPLSVVGRVLSIVRLLWTTLGGEGGGGFMSHEFEPLYSFVEIIFSLLLTLMRVFSKYLIRINPFVKQRYRIH